MREATSATPRGPFSSIAQTLRRRGVAILVLGGLVLFAAGIWYYLRPGPVDRAFTLATLFGVLEARGYRANHGFSGSFEPGTLVQVRGADIKAGESDLPEPVIFKWGRECFPTLEPKSVNYALPEWSGKRADQLELDGRALDRETPLLSLRDSLVASYRLKLSGLRLQVLAKGDLSGEFSPECVQALDKAISSGEEIGWYRVVVETLTVQSLTYEIEWRKATDVSVRLALVDALRKRLGQLSGKTGTPGAALQTRSIDDNRTVLEVSVGAIVAYRLRPVELWNKRSQQNGMP